MKRTIIPALAALGLSTAVLAADAFQTVSPSTGPAPVGAVSKPRRKRKKVKHQKKAAAPAPAGTMEKKPMEGTSTVQ